MVLNTFKNGYDGKFMVRVFYSNKKIKIRGKRKICSYYFTMILGNPIEEVEMTKTLANYIET